MTADGKRKPRYGFGDIVMPTACHGSAEAANLTVPFEVANARPGQGSLNPVHDARAFADQALALAVWPLGVLFGNRGHARHAAMAPFSTQPPQEPALQQLGVEPVGLCPAMFPRNCHTRGMDHVRLYPARNLPPRQRKFCANTVCGSLSPPSI